MPSVAPNPGELLGSSMPGAESGHDSLFTSSLELGCNVALPLLNDLLLTRRLAPVLAEQVFRNRVPQSATFLCVLLGKWPNELGNQRQLIHIEQRFPFLECQ